ncbi:MAG: PRC-barrel domain-containing protein [bacterium]
MRLALVRKNVVTESGIALGKVSDVEILWPECLVKALTVRGGLTSLRQTFLIDPEAIMRVEETAIIVRDAAIKEKAASFRAALNIAARAPKPSMERRK